MSKILETKRILRKDLKPYPGNARKGDLDMIRESLRVNGQYRPIVVQESTGYILAGNHTWEAAGLEHWEEMDATFVDCDDEQAKKIVLVDNRSNDVAEYDNEALAALLTELPEFEGTGFSQQDLDDLLAELGGGFGGADPNHAPPVSDDPVTERGDVYDLGDHRLVCGDATEEEDRQLLLHGEIAALVLTDPPYAINYQQNLSAEEAARLHRRVDGKQIEHNEASSEEASEFIGKTFLAIFDVLAPGGSYYVFGPPGPDFDRFTTNARNSGLFIKQSLVWVKDQFVFGRQDYHYQHENLVYGWKPGEGHTFIDDRTKTSLLEFDRPKQSKEHPTMKPLDLTIELLRNSSKPGALVVDLFGGSGTTLVACAESGRRCYMMELDPAYCDVIVQRWEATTGGQAVRHRGAA